VNLGGGGNVGSDWLTADLDPRADVYVDLRRKLPFGDAAIDGIVLEEVVEHLRLNDALRLLEECRRILKSRGSLRISTPDLDWLNAMRNDSAMFFSDRFLVAAAARQTRGDLPAKLKVLAAYNSTFYDHGHRFIYDVEGLLQLIEYCGFANAKRSSYRDAEARLGHYDSHADRCGHSPELSQYVECEGPHKD
jgi:SAM-dependent methyltransferase